jgi:nicotinamide-nucleotide amidase
LSPYRFLPTRALYARLLKRLREGSGRLVTAESLTGGMIGAAITAIPGSSDVYYGGFVSYWIPAKVDWLGIPAEVIERCGVVSSETARAMAEGALARGPATISVAVTGIAGPGGGSPSQSVGTVWIATGRKVDGVVTSSARAYRFRGGRSRVRNSTVRAAALCLLAELGCLDIS